MIRLLLVMMMVGLWAMPAQAARPIISDSRIRTYVYNPNEVFKLTTEYGYQSNIVFAPDEVIESLSVGDVSGFKITPSKNRLFIRAMKSDFHTNMTVVSNLRVYQFDLSSFIAGNEDIMYVLRFYYPEEDVDQETGQPLNAGDFLRPAAPVAAGASYATQAAAPPMPMQVAPMVVASPLPAPAPPVPVYAVPSAGQQAVPTTDNQAWSSRMDVQAAPAEAVTRNFDYAMQGPESLAPWQIFDEKGRTYVKYAEAGQSVPAFYTLRDDGTKVPLMLTFENEYIVFDGVHLQFFIERDGATMRVVNEQQAATGKRP